MPSKKTVENLSSVAQVAEQIAHLAATKRIIVAVCGAPGAGKTTFAAKLVNALAKEPPNYQAQVIAMDGFHYDNQYLADKGMLAVKGAPQTFDINGFENLLKALQEQTGTLYAPGFDRNSEQVIDNEQQILPQTPIIIVEGNYLLLNQAPWARLVKYFDTSLFMQVELAELERRLIQRWLDQDFDLSAAKQKAIGNDMVNAKLVIEHSMAPDIIFTRSI